MAQVLQKHGLDGITPDANKDGWRHRLAGGAEVLSEEASLERRRHDNEARRPARQLRQLHDEEVEEVCVHGPLVHLVEHDVRPLEHLGGVVRKVLEKIPDGYERDERRATIDVVALADPVSDLFPQQLAALIGHAARKRDRGDASWLCDHNLDPFPARLRVFHEELWDHGRLAAARLTLDARDLVRTDVVEDLAAVLEDRELLLHHRHSFLVPLLLRIRLVLLAFLLSVLSVRHARGNLERSGGLQQPVRVRKRHQHALAQRLHLQRRQHLCVRVPHRLDLRRARVHVRKEPPREELRWRRKVPRQPEQLRNRAERLRCRDEQRRDLHRARRRRARRERRRVRAAHQQERAAEQRVEVVGVDGHAAVRGRAVLVQQQQLAEQQPERAERRLDNVLPDHHHDRLRRVLERVVGRHRGPAGCVHNPEQRVRPRMHVQRAQLRKRAAPVRLVSERVRLVRGAGRGVSD